MKLATPDAKQQPGKQTLDLEKPLEGLAPREKTILMKWLFFMAEPQAEAASSWIPRLLLRPRLPSRLSQPLRSQNKVQRQT